MGPKVLVFHFCGNRVRKASGTERCVIKQQKRKWASSVELNVFEFLGLVNECCLVRGQPPSPEPQRLKRLSPSTPNQKGSMKVPSIGFTDQDLGSRVGSGYFST